MLRHTGFAGLAHIRGILAHTGEQIARLALLIVIAGEHQSSLLGGFLGGLRQTLNRLHGRLRRRHHVRGLLGGFALFVLPRLPIEHRLHHRLLDMFLLGRLIRELRRLDGLCRLSGLSGLLNRLNKLHGLGRGFIRTAIQHRLVPRLRTLGLEHGRRLAGTQVKNLIDGHIRRIGFLMRDHRRRVVEQVRHGRALIRLRSIHAFEIGRHVAELHAHRRVGKYIVVVFRQAHQLAVVADDVGAVGRIEIVQDGLAVTAYGELRMALRHGFGGILHLHTPRTVIGQRSQGLTSNLNVLTRMNSDLLVTVDRYLPVARHFSTHRIASFFTIRHYSYCVMQQSLLGDSRSGINNFLPLTAKPRHLEPGTGFRGKL